VRPASTLLLLRDDPAFEVLMVERHHQIDFASGALVFPGGKSSPGDHDEAWREHALGWVEHGADQSGLRIAAIREVFEEAGLLLARRADGARSRSSLRPLSCASRWIGARRRFWMWCGRQARSWTCRR